MSVSNIAVFDELKRRIDLTRRARIQASTRLRKKHEFYEITNYIYSFSILILSVWVIGINDNNSYNITKVLLIASIIVTFFTMFLGVKNYKERASNIESNYLQLSVLINKMQRMEVSKELITQDDLKILHREYENLLIGNENHVEIDFFRSTKENKENFKNQIFFYLLVDSLKKIFIYIPLIALFIYIVNVG